MNLTHKNVIQDFLSYLAKERNFSIHTITAYEYDLKRFFTFLKNYDSSMLQDLKKIDKIAIRHFIGMEYEDGKSPTTRSRRLASIRSLFRYLIHSEDFKDNPAMYVSKPNNQKHLPKFVHEQDIDKLMHMPNGTTITGKRDRAILEIFYATGIRLSELLGLNFNSVNFNENLIKVLGKGNRERLVPFGEKAKEALEIYLKEREISNISDKTIPLFTSNRGKRISGRAVQERLSKYLKLIIGDKGASPHTLRHTFGTHLLDNDADIRSIQELLGHRSISSTQIYTSVNPEKIKKIYKKHHPHAS